MGSDHPSKGKEANWLTGQMLIAMPGMADPRFARTVTLLCSHGPEGAMGIVVNRLYGDIQFKGLLSQLNIPFIPGSGEMPIHFGGPVEPTRGFVLHSTDYARQETVRISDAIALTATVEVLRALADGEGPRRALLALGYAGWSAGQLETELQTSGWLVAPPDEDVIFDTSNPEDKWQRAFTKLGISPAMLSGDIGHA